MYTIEKSLPSVLNLRLFGQARRKFNEPEKNDEEKNKKEQNAYRKKYKKLEFKNGYEVLENIPGEDLISNSLVFILIFTIIIFSMLGIFLFFVPIKIRIN